jgi:hypothetical protein
VNRRDAADLILLVEKLINGVDQSPQLAAEIEGILIECCQDQSWFDEASEALAMFVPGGGGYYLDEQGLVEALRPVASALRRVLSENP